MACDGGILGGRRLVDGVLGPGRPDLVQPLAQGPELQGVEQPVDRAHGPRPRARADRGQGRREHRRAAAVRCRLTRTCGRRAAKRVADLAAAPRPRGRRAPARDPYCRSHLAAVFSPTPGMPGKVVAGITPQRRVVGVLRRRQAVLLLDRRRRHAGQVADPLLRVQDRDPIAHELERVAVARDDVDRHVPVAGQRAPGWR